VRYDFDPTVNFKDYRSFAWCAASKKAQGKQPAESNPLEAQELINRAVRDLLEKFPPR
jgi:hypothetical protein